MMYSLLAAFHSSLDFAATTVLAVLLLHLMLAVFQTLKGAKQGLTGTLLAVSSKETAVKNNTPCTSDPSVGDVLRLYFGYYSKTDITTVKVGNLSEEVQNASRLGTEGLDNLTCAIKSTIGVNDSYRIANPRKCYCLPVLYGC